MWPRDCLARAGEPAAADARVRAGYPRLRLGIRGHPCARRQTERRPCCGVRSLTAAFQRPHSRTFCTEDEVLALATESWVALILGIAVVVVLGIVFAGRE